MKTTLVVFLIMAVSTAVSPTEEPGTLLGEVRDATGAIAPQAVIQIQHWTLTNLKRQPMVKIDANLVADDHGRFSVPLKPDLYEVFVSDFAMAPKAVLVKIEEGKTNKMEIQLEGSSLIKIIQ